MTPGDMAEAAEIFVSTSYTEVPDDAQQRLAASVDHFIVHDPGGAWLATLGDTSVGFALACRRDDLWILAALFVRPEHQAEGAGRTLLAQALTYRGPAARSMIMSSGDPRATSLYARAGLAPHPTLHAAGRPDRRAIPAGLDAREVSADDVERLTRTDIAVRGSGRSQDLEFMLREGARGLFIDRRRRSGYVLFREGDPPVDGIPLVLVASDVPLARSLLWQALAEASSDVLINAMTPTRQWAIDVALDARLRLMPGGPFFVHGVEHLPAPWIPSGFFG